MKKNILLISLLVMFFSCASQLDGISQSDKYVEKSIQYYKNKKYSKARDRFQNIINNNQGTVLAVESLYYLALCEYELKEFNNAKQSFKEYVRYSQDDLRRQDAEFKISLCMYELTLDYNKDQTATKKAIDEFQQFIEKYPGDKKYLLDVNQKINLLRQRLALKQYKSAILYIKSGKYDSAKIYLDELLKKFRDTKYADDARIAQIIIFLMNGQLEEARKYLKNNKCPNETPFTNLCDMNYFDQPNGIYDDGEIFEDLNDNGKWDFIDKNNNGKYDNGELGEPFNDNQDNIKYNEAKSIIENSVNQSITIKNLYFIDYLKKIL